MKGKASVRNMSVKSAMIFHSLVELSFSLWTHTHTHTERARLFMTPAASLCAFINILEKMRCVGFRLDWAYYLTAI